MKVCYYYREPVQGTYSIEEVFSNIRGSLPSQIQQAQWVEDRQRSRFTNVIDVSNTIADIHHITGACNYVAIGLPTRNTILTVHDIGSYEESMKGWKRSAYGLFWWRIPLRKVRHITAISRFTKQKLISFFGVDANKITVIHNPAPLGFNYTEKILDQKIPRILQIGSGKNKNLLRLIQAVEDLPCKLILINKLANGERRILEEKEIAYEQHINLTRDEVIDQYKKCDLVFFASTYEGFGLPILEAQSIGRPVITSNTCSMPEVAGKAAILVDPFDTLEIRLAITSLIDSKYLASELVDKGQINIKRFESTVVAEQYCTLYDRINGK